jgi:hypothetical protein
VSTSEMQQAIRVLPFGFVAHDEAANASALLDAAVTVGADGVVRRISLSWGTWDYTVTYGKLGATRPWRRRRMHSL